MNNKNGLKIISVIMTLAIGVLSLGQSMLDRKLTKYEIDSKIEKAVAKRLGN